MIKTEKSSLGFMVCYSWFFLILNPKALVAHIIADDFLEASIEKKIPTVKI